MHSVNIQFLLNACIYLINKGLLSWPIVDYCCWWGSWCGNDGFLLKQLVEVTHILLTMLCYKGKRPYLQCDKFYRRGIKLFWWKSNASDAAKFSARKYFQIWHTFSLSNCSRYVAPRRKRIDNRKLLGKNKANNNSQKYLRKTIMILMTMTTN